MTAPLQATLPVAAEGRPASPGLQFRESLAGRLLRESGDLGGLRAVLCSVGYRRQTVENLAEFADALGSAIGADPKSLRRQGYIVEQGRRGRWCFGFDSQRLRRFMLSLRHPKVCPECLAADGIHRQIWDLHLYTDCTAHQVQLIDSCPWCGDPIRWFRATCTRCDQCGGDYGSAPRVASDPEVIGLLKDIGRVLSGEEPRRLPGFDQAVTRSQRLNALLEVYILLGRAVLRSWDLPTPAVAKRDLEDIRRVIKAASTVLDGTWTAFDHFLDSTYKVLPVGEQPTMVQLFPRLYRSLFRYSRDRAELAPALSIVQKQFTRFLARHPELASKMSGNVLVIRTSALREERVNLESIVQELGIGGGKVRSLGETLGIDFAEVNWAGGSRYATRGDVDRMKAALVRHPELAYGELALLRAQSGLKAAGRRDTYAEADQRAPLQHVGASLQLFASGLGFPQNARALHFSPALRVPTMAIARRLGISAPTVRRMIDGGLFSASDGDSPEARFVTVAAYNAFESALHRQISRSDAARAGRLVSLPDALKQHSLRPHRFDMTRLLRTAICGKLGHLHVLPSKRGLFRLALTAEQVYRLRALLNEGAPSSRSPLAASDGATVAVASSW